MDLLVIPLLPFPFMGALTMVVLVVTEAGVTISVAVVS